MHLELRLQKLDEKDSRQEVQVTGGVYENHVANPPQVTKCNTFTDTDFMHCDQMLIQIDVDRFPLHLCGLWITVLYTVKKWFPFPW